MFCLTEGTDKPNIDFARFELHEIPLLVIVKNGTLLSPQILKPQKIHIPLTPREKQQDDPLTISSGTNISTYFVSGDPDKNSLFENEFQLLQRKTQNKQQILSSFLRNEKL